MTRIIASLLCIALAASACASGRPATYVATPDGLGRAADRDVLTDYAGRLRIGARIKATVTGNRVIRGTLLKRTDRGLVIQPRARVAEPLVEVAFTDLLALEEEVRSSSGGAARAIAIGAGVGAGAALGMLMLFAALAFD